MMGGHLTQQGNWSRQRERKMIDQPSLPIFEGIRWGMPRVTNTCPLDSWLDLICVPHHANLLLNPYPELQDITSILSRAFEFLLNNDRDAALMVWLRELYQFSDEDMLVRKDFWGSTDRSFEKIKVKNQADCPNPLDETLRLRFRCSIRCIHEGGCKMLDSTIICSHIEDPDEEVVDLGANCCEVRRSQLRVTCANGLCWPIRSLHLVPVPHWTSFTREIFHWRHRHLASRWHGATSSLLLADWSSSSNM